MSNLPGGEVASRVRLLHSGGKTMIVAWSGSTRVCPIVLAMLVLAACGGERDPRTPEEASARGDALLRSMSDTLARAKAFSFTSSESHERVRRNGEKSPFTLTRVVVQRPNRLWSHTTGSDNRDVTVTYDGSTVSRNREGEAVHEALRSPFVVRRDLRETWGGPESAARSRPAPAARAQQAESSREPLPSWNDGDSKKAIVDFVARVTREGAPDFVPIADRIATFDNDGTLWAEQPVYVQLAFALDRVRALAPKHPEWQQTQPFKAVLEGDVSGVAASGQRGLTEIVAATHAGNTTGEFEAIVREWIGTARHPQSRRLYTEMVYQPMLEVLAYLRSKGFKTFVVSGGGVEFMRPWVERVYGIPPEQVVGSRAKVKYELRDGRPALFRLPEIDLVDDGAGKPVGIHQVIGRRPIAAFGNSDGDFEMIEWTTSGAGARLGLIVHHTDAGREWAYDRSSHIGRLARGLDEAPKRGWIVVDMKRDWKVIYPYQQRP